MTIQDLLLTYGEEYNEALIFTVMYLFLRDASIDKAEFSNILHLVNTQLNLVSFPVSPSDSVTTSESVTIVKT
jgi:hypothetical protein